MKKLPIFDIILNDQDTKQGVGKISLVDEPAIGVDWIKLGKESLMTFKADREKQILYGPFLIPDMLIYRNDEKNGEYYVRFSKEEIEKIATKFNEDLNNKNINFQHTEEMVDAFVSQNWIIEGDQDKSKTMGFDLPEGTWFGGVKVKDTYFWNDKVKSDEVRGFSVEIMANLELVLKKNNNKMKELKFKKKFIAKQKFDEAVETEAGELIVVAEEIVVGAEVVVVMDDLAVVGTFDGTVEVDGETVVIESGVITEIMAGEDTPDGDTDLADEEMPEGNAGGITADEVSQMIDVRFGEIMEEITRLKEAMGGQKEELSKVIDEKLKTTPSVSSVKSISNVDEKFKAIEMRVRDFINKQN